MDPIQMVHSGILEASFLLILPILQLQGETFIVWVLAIARLQVLINITGMK